MTYLLDTDRRAFSLHAVYRADGADRGLGDTGIRGHHFPGGYRACKNLVAGIDECLARRDYMYYCVYVFSVYAMKTAKVFKQGNSQAVRLPKEFRVATNELFIKRSGDSIVLTPKKTSTWKNLRAAIVMFKGPIARRQPVRFDRRRIWPA